MGWLEALVLGIVQGLTEFLPISSSAHQSIIGQFFGGEDVGAAFTAITQLGTEAAVILFFRRDIWLIIKHWTLALVGRLPATTRKRAWVGSLFSARFRSWCWGCSSRTRSTQRCAICGSPRPC